VCDIIAQWRNFVIHAERNLTTDLKEYDIQAPLRDSYSFAQMIVVKTILIDLEMQPKCQTRDIL
jgi:hypothetical protein